MRRRFQIGMGVNPSLIINKGIYIQHVDGGLYTKENWSNKGYSNDLCNPRYVSPFTELIL